MARPRLLDLFCGAGGAAMGYHRAGFDVTGVDIAPQPRYPFRFVQADAMTYPLEGYDAIHASPPCQAFTAYRRRSASVGADYPDLIADVRGHLLAAGKPWVMENVVRSPVRPHVCLCGSSFGLDVQRHRWFETTFPALSPPCVHGVWKQRFPHATNRSNLRRTVEIGVWRIPLPVQQAAMGIDWMTLGELSQAIPPAYTEYIGGQLLREFPAREPAGRGTGGLGARNE